MDKFLEIYGTLPRAGPGSNQLTRRAFRVIRDIPGEPRILDVGCGPGMQTVELLRISDATVVALDLLPQMLNRVQAAAKTAGVADRLITLQENMHEMEFPASGFDVIWAEGAIYLLGFEAGLEKFKRIVKPGGYIAVSDAVWLKPDPPSEALEFWAEYPDIAPVEEKRRVIERVGLTMVDHFVFPHAAWTEHYYDPMENRIAGKSREWKDDPNGEAVLNEARHEIAVFRKYGDFYSYAFFIMRNPESG